MQCTQLHFLEFNYALLTSYYTSKLIKRHFLKTKLQIFEAKSDISGGPETLWLISMSNGSE